ncbi:hypothetical protein RFI_04211, partial [Reticulomyxa filosa]
MFGDATYERQLLLLTFAALLHAINALIMLRPKDLYYPLEESTCCKWNCLRVQHKYKEEYAMLVENKTLDALLIVPNRSNSRIREPSGSRVAAAMEKSSRISLESVLADKNGFELFASHLVKELSLENVLFLVEYMQLKYFLSVHQLDKHVRDLGYNVPIYPSLIQKTFHSQLLCTDMSADIAWNVCLDMFHYLSSHYILPNAVALLNLSYESSSAIAQQMLLLTSNRAHAHAHNTLPSLLAVFDYAARDIVRLLRGDSFYRFQLSRECVRYCEEL